MRYVPAGAFCRLGESLSIGPGLVLKDRASRQWNIAVGGRYERLLFRLDKIGKDPSFRLFGSLTDKVSPIASFNPLGGFELSLELWPDEESYDTGGFPGLTFNLRL